jgi:hypothetical protein
VTVEQRTAAKGAAGGLSKQAVGAFILGLCFEIEAIPKDIGPYVTMVLMFLFSQAAYVIMTPKQWKSILGQSQNGT